MQPPPASNPSVTDEVETLRLRRSPKYGVFLVAGAAVGLIVAMILTFAFNGTAQASPNTGLEYTQLQVFGFVALMCVPIGLALGGAVALLLERMVGRRTREVRVDHSRVRGTD